MKVSYKWLCELTGVDWPVKELAERLTLCGTACEDIAPLAQYMQNVVVGKVDKVEKVEGADKIVKATVDLGKEKLTVVCGAPNVAEGQTVPVALIGAKLAGEMEIKRAKIRGVESTGMICSERELGLSDDHSGIMVLDDSLPAGAPLADALNLDDYILTFELTPNRGDSMSAIGIARDLAAIASVKLKRPTTAIKESTEKATDLVSVKIEDPDACPRYAARIIRDVKIGESPQWVKNKLIASGVRPISNVVDVTNLVMLETGHPLHAFDFHRFGSSEVVVRRARDKERFTTLDGKERELTPDVLMITNGKEGVAVGGIMGGLNSEISDDTKDILLEAAYFNPVTIRRGRRHLGMMTESSQRFEKGTDPNGVPYAIDRAAYLFQELCGGSVSAEIVDCYPKKIEPNTIDYRPSRCTPVLGADIPHERMAAIMTDLEFDVRQGQTWRVTVPTFRTDLDREIDLVEEVARIYGYHQIPDAVTNIGPLFNPTHFGDVFIADTRRVLSGAGFDEILDHGLGNDRKMKMFAPGIALLRIVNPNSEDLNVMRSSMLPTLLNVVGHNIAHRNLDLRLFEIGKVYFPPNEKGEWVEQDRISLAVTGRSEISWRDKPRPLDYYDLTGGIEALGHHFSWPAFEYRPAAHEGFESSATFDIMLKGETIGLIGQVNSATARKFDIKQAVFAAEFATAGLIGASRKLKEYQPLPVYPAALRDIAMVVDESIPAGELVRAIRKSAGELADEVKIFDLYTGQQIPQGKKSIAIAIDFRSRERSLSSDEVDTLQETIVRELKQQFKAEIRDK